ncbi:hypothetical protein NPIL_172941 [Nephila pilipes]|uniref:Uncharacterized protein n=1 Tax=Nephila pilipes TaxID=299642 RepID=A0A8X6NSL1_NEPPI|nr:hypothetical protein NPIL_172941 [Nephila pilipes]
MEHPHVIPNERSPFKCYSCGRLGVINSTYSTCYFNFSRRTNAATNNANAHATETRSPRLTLINMKEDVHVQTQSRHIQLLGIRCARYSRIRDSSSRKPR